ncbi:MAG: AraC-like DNA-binding protein [Cryomorphaceae bacterium]
MENTLYISSTYLKILARGNQQLISELRNALGPKADELLESEYIYGDNINRVFSAFETQGVDSLLLRYGRHLDVASHGPLGFSVLTAPDLKTAMQVLEEYMHIRSSVYRCEFTVVDDRAEFIGHDLTGEAIAGRWLIEIGLNVVQRLIESVMAHPLGENARISFAYAKPAYAQELEDFYNVGCDFNAAKNMVSFPASWCRINSPFYDPQAFRSNIAKCRDLKLTLEGNSLPHEFITLKFNYYFTARLAGETTARELPSLEGLASQLHMSTRTLTRRLKQRKTSYKRLLEQARQIQAIYLLENTHLPIADVAYNLAYQEPANFVRAFKTWFDTTPAAWRRTPTKTND